MARISSRPFDTGNVCLLHTAMYSRVKLELAFYNVELAHPLNTCMFSGNNMLLSASAIFGHFTFDSSNNKLDSKKQKCVAQAWTSRPELLLQVDTGPVECFTLQQCPVQLSIL